MSTSTLDRRDERVEEVVRDGPGRRSPWLRRLRNVALGFVVFLVAGNAVIMASMAWFRLTAPDVDLGTAVGIDNFRAVDDKVFRGADPDAEDYTRLAELGVTMVVDLRAEADNELEDRSAAAAGLDRVHLPTRDGQLPSEEQVAEFLDTVEATDGAVFLHCGAGVGRTGAMSAFYLNATGQTEGTEALRQNLSVGPPSLEQIAFSVTTSDGEYHKPALPVTVLSRVLDGPRRIWHNLT